MKERFFLINDDDVGLFLLLEHFVNIQVKWTYRHWRAKWSHLIKIEVKGLLTGLLCLIYDYKRWPIVLKEAYRYSSTYNS